MNLGKGVAAVVTGGASGLGEATVRRLVARGVSVAIFDRNSKLGTALASQLGCRFFEVDVASDESITGALAAARAAQGQERILVNCAGVAAMVRVAKRDKTTGKAVYFPYQKALFNIQVNLLGSFMCAAQSAAGMLALDPVNEDGERGVIINVSSTEAVEGKIGAAAYSASKGGVLGMTLPMARDLREDGIRVNTILPGFFMTAMAGSGPQAEAYHERLIADIQFPKRPGRPDEFAQLAEHLIENSYINGACIRIDAGQRLSAT
jgi:NAD(P)-dependent dehydrogenase (short-subunit alcohol dehydrogenase family)